MVEAAFAGRGIVKFEFICHDDLWNLKSLVKSPALRLSRSAVRSVNFLDFGEFMDRAVGESEKGKPGCALPRGRLRKRRSTGTKHTTLAARK